jgi:hypothetical protein
MVFRFLFAARGIVAAANEVSRTKRTERARRYERSEPRIARRERSEAARPNLLQKSLKKVWIVEESRLSLQPY